MKKILRAIRKFYYSTGFKYQRLVEITIKKDHILHNFKVYQKLSPSLKIAPVLKSNAYGHGLSQIAQIIDRKNIPFIAVDSYGEALTLRMEGIKSPILIIGYTASKNIFETLIKKTSFTIINLDQLSELAEKLRRNISVHMMIDTGMNRQGIRPEELDRAIECIKKNSHIVLEGICSHLADADSEDPLPTERQIEKWNNSVELFHKHFPQLPYWHLSATSGFLYAQKINANVARLGIGLYGYPINTEKEKNLDLKPALEMKSLLSGIKKIKKGEQVGYNFTFTAEKDMTIATIPVGYFEGVDRRLSNNGFVKIGGQFCPIIGRVSMNITVVDITDLPIAKRDQPVIIISDNFQDKNSVQQIATACKTIPYEILVHLPSQLRRVID